MNTAPVSCPSNTCFHVSTIFMLFVGKHGITSFIHIVYIYIYIFNRTSHQFVRNVLSS